jgi:PhzF family phenazine biosynthesis protein
MIELPLYIIDAFTSKLFSGNPAAVCPLEKWLPDAILQAIASENNLSETAFFVSRGSRFELRWFTPLQEVDLCGHATLASAFVLFENLGHKETEIIFDSKSGPLKVTKGNQVMTLDFPGRRVEPCTPPEALLRSLPEKPTEVLESGPHTYIAVYDNENSVRSFKPDFTKLAQVDRGVNITAPGKECDFVSRYFSPALGLAEDPVTGSAHCGLAIYWSKRLNRSDVLHAIQCSQRGGELFCQAVGNRVLISGSAVQYLQGTVMIPLPS